MTEGGSDYIPISCVLHSQYELAIMHETKLNLSWQDKNKTFSAIVIPLDIKTRQREEFLIARDLQGQQYTIRLDQIKACEAIEK